MVGQKHLLEMMDTWISNNSVPRFLIISGEKLSGKFTLVKEFRDKLDCYLISCELGVESVREAVKNCYKCDGTTIYLFRDADRMSSAAKNALLKITEEPPRKAVFIMTVENSQNVLETLRSRAVNIQTGSYSGKELDEYYRNFLGTSERVRLYADSPGIMRALSSINVEELVEFCNMIIDNILTVSGVNAFKITNRIKIKEDGEGYDARLFFKVFKGVLAERMMDKTLNNTQEDLIRYGKMLTLTSKYEREFNSVGIKKDSTLDMWILEIREVLI